MEKFDNKGDTRNVIFDSKNDGAVIDTGQNALSCTVIRLQEVSTDVIIWERRKCNLGLKVGVYGGKVPFSWLFPQE